MRSTLFALCLMPLSASAESLLESAAMMSEYASAYATFGIGDMSHGWEEMVAGTDAMLTGMTGRWFDAGVLAAGPQFPVHMRERACAQIAVQVDRQGDLGFSITRVAGGDRTLTVTYSYIFARSFQVSADMDQVQDFLGIPAENRPYQGIYTDSDYRGIVEVFHPSPRIMVIQRQGGLADIYMRCP
jgi:hypothetical protein